MLSRQIIFKRSLKPAFCVIKDNAAHIHVGCAHSIKLNVQANKYFKNCRRNLFSLGQQIRCESTNSPTTLHSQSNTASELGPIPEPPVPLPDITKTTVEAISGEPSFSSLGLGGWYPTGMVQNCLEYLHIDLGLPWWGAVVCGTFVIRLLMFPLVIKSQRSAALLNNYLPEVQSYQVKLTEARQRGDKIEAARYSHDMMNFMSEKGVNPIKTAIPALLQAPVFISVFMGLRAMSNLPVESLKTGGMLWFVDLTIPDQFYLLPLITCGTVYFTIALGVDGTASTQNMLLMKYLMRGLPVIMIPFVINFPGIILVYWTTTNFISLGQVAFLKIPAVRNFFSIERKIKHDKEVLPVKDKGFINNAKNAWSNLKLTSELQERERADRMAFMKAGREPIKKTYKHDPTRPTPAAIQAKKSM